MKKISILIFLLQTCMLMYAGTDKNESMKIGNVSDLEFNSNPEAVFVNGIFVKSIIGVRLDKYIVNVSKEKCMSPLNINGVTYTYKCNLTSDKVIKFVSLENLKKIYCPNVKTPCFYMINKNFILKEIDSYKIDKDFILKVETVSSSDVEGFKNATPFTIIRIYTDIESNKNPMRIR